MSNSSPTATAVMKLWLEPDDLPISADLLHLLRDLPPQAQTLIAQALLRRGLGDPAAARAFLDPAHYTPAAPEAMPGVGQAAALVGEAVSQGQGVLVWGDFDVDGQTSTALLVACLRELGASVRYHIPVRSRESHGVGAGVLAGLLDAPLEGPPTGLLLTCDTGIAAHEAVAYARQSGLVVVVTDHHELPPALPEAHAIVTPRLLPEGHPLAPLPGVGVAYKLAEALYSRAGLPPQSIEAHLDLVALGIVADVAALHGEARYLLQRGLEVLRQAQRAGLQALMEFADLQPATLNEEHIGFALAPRLNALGRLSDANPAVELLTTGDMGRARLLAVQLEGLNSRRQLLTSQTLRAALAQVEQDPSLLELDALVLAHPAWPAGVIGIVASHLVERFGKPVALLSAPPGEMARGSARSVEGVDITTALATQAALLQGYGGHRMAAGFAIDPERLPEFRRGLSRAVAAQGPLPAHTLSIDGYLELSDLSLELAAAIERLAPFGAGNPPLALASRGLSLLSQAPLGRQDEHLLLSVEDQAGNSQRLIWWGAGALGEAAGLLGSRFDLAYTLRAVTFRGARQLQVELLDLRPIVDEITLQEQPPVLDLLDYRLEAHPLPILRRLVMEQASLQPGAATLQIWAEAGAKGKLEEELKRLAPDGNWSVRGRDELSSAPVLVIWTAPPGPSELRRALEAAQPGRQVLFGLEPETASLEPFLERLAGLAKYVLGRGETVTLTRLAAAAAQSEAAVRLGLSWLEGRGLTGALRIANLPPPPHPANPDDLQRDLLDLLDESRAYRLYFRRAENPLPKSLP